MYDPTNLTNPVNQVRYLLGGELTDDLLTDEEIAARLPGGALATASVTEAAIACGEYLVRKARWNVDIGGSVANARLSQLAPQIERTVAELRQQAAGTSATASLLAAITTDANGEAIRSAFTRRMGDPGSDWP